jgi:ATP-dependent DNA helicase RecQ
MDIKISSLFENYFPDLANKFNLNDFQEKSVSNVLNKNNTLCILPTGGGKSLIYWLSGVALNGVTIVISPLIALIDEQASKIEEQGYQVLTLHGGITAKKQVELLKKFYRKELNPDFIFVSPERISMDGLFEFCIKSRSDDIKLIAIDEVHCVSQWGFSFRPFYKRIPDFLNNIFGNQWPTILGLTATLNPKEIKDICNHFNISSSNIIKSDLLVRSEIELKKIQFHNEDEKEEKLWDLLKIHKGEKILVYLYRKYHKRGTEELKNKAIEKGFRAINFHGDMSSKERQEIISAFKNGDFDVVFATNAFGMGIDIPDIRVVIHFMMPESVEQYYQEVGRASRDGQASNAYILYTNKNIQVKKSHFIDRSFPSIEKLHDVFKKITNNRQGLKTVTYFDDDEIQQCLAYFLDNNILTIVSKGLISLDIFSDIKNAELNHLLNLTKNKGTLRTVKKSGLSPSEISEVAFSAIANDEVKLTKNMKKCLIVENKYEDLEEKLLKLIEQNIEEKRNYKHQLLDYFTYILENCDNSKELHQEIGRYLGVPKHQLNKIYKTKKGDLVRSKSELIIANLLVDENIEYEYEKKLFYTDNRWIEPDFTITLGDKEIYWEHLGMIGTESYDRRWLEKLSIYETYFPGQLVTTYEGATLTDSVRVIIKKVKNY